MTEEEAVEIYTRAVVGSNQDKGLAQITLALCYYHGTAPKIDKVLAHKWFKIAESNFGFEDTMVSEMAKCLGDIFAKDMSEKDMTRAQELADDWIKRNRKTT